MKHRGRPCVAVIGPTNLPRIAAATGIPQDRYVAYAGHVGELLAAIGSTLVVVPDRGVAMAALTAYRERGGPWVVGIAPTGGECDPEAQAVGERALRLCDEVLGSVTWYEQHAAICRVSDLMIGIGLSCGTMVEMAWTKWIKKPEVLVLAPTVSVIPPEILAESAVRLVPDLAQLTRAVGAHLDAGPAAALRGGSP